MPDFLAYAMLFTGVGAFFIFLHLMIGKLVRPKKPDPEKLTIYECGEPTIGSAWVQFDLRFYVVALLFVIFDVEMAFFFPWAVVFGKANQLASELKPEDRAQQERIALNHELSAGLKPQERETAAMLLGDPQVRWESEVKRFQDLLAAARDDSQRAHYQEQLDLLQKNGPSQAAQVKSIEMNRETARTLGWVAFGDILVFFGVLLVGFAYLWRRGDLDWVRSIAAQRLATEEQEIPEIRSQTSEVSETAH